MALYAGMISGLVAPGWQMAEIVAKNLTGGDERFQGTDLSTKLKLMGVDVASFGDYEAAPERAKPLTWEDPFRGVYKKLLFTHDGARLLGGVFVGDADDYGILAALAKSGEELSCKPHELIMGKAGGTAGTRWGCKLAGHSADLFSVTMSPREPSVRPSRPGN